MLDDAYREPPFVHGECDDRSAQVIQIDNGKYISVVAVCAALCGISCVMSFLATNEARTATTEYRVLLNHTMELEAKQKAMEESYGKR